MIMHVLGAFSQLSGLYKSQSNDEGLLLAVMWATVKDKRNDYACAYRESLLWWMWRICWAWRIANWNIGQLNAELHQAMHADWF